MDFSNKLIGIKNENFTDCDDNNGEAKDDVLQNNEICTKKSINSNRLPINKWNDLSWTCYLCTEIIIGFNNFLSHMQNLHSSNKELIFQCHDCKKPLHTYASFINHIRSIQDTLKLCCDVCSEMLPSYSELSLHRDKHVDAPNNIHPAIYHCTLCEKVHSTEEELKTHILNSHNLLCPKVAIISNNQNGMEDVATSRAVSSLLNPTTKQCYKIEKHFKNEKCLEGSESKNMLESNPLEISSVTDWTSFDWICYYCNTIFQELKLLKIHLESSHEITNMEDACYKCSDCEEPFFNYASLINHIRSVHHVGLKLCCDVCSEMLGTAAQLSIHRNIHNEMFDIVHPILHHCNVCEKVHSTEKELKNHIQLFHNLTCSERSAKDLYFDSKKDQLERTQIVVKQENICPTSDIAKGVAKSENVSSTLVIEKIEEEYNDTEQTFQCGKCVQSFLKEKDLKLHSSIHEDGGLFKCSWCPRTFQFKSKLQNHARVHTNERPYGCKICTAKFPSRQNLKRHMLKHSDERPYKCELCEKSFKKKQDKEVHMKLHTDERPYKCEICSKSYVSSKDLKYHQRKHTGECPFECEVCKKGFHTKGSWKSHLLMHSDNYPFQCEVCERIFKRKEQKTVHMRKHTGERPFKCKLCTKDYPNSQNLKDHMRTHTGERPYKCDTCNKTFNSPGYFKIHMFRLHNEDQPFVCTTCSSKFGTESDLKKHTTSCQGSQPTLHFIEEVN